MFRIFFFFSFPRDLGKFLPGGVYIIVLHLLVFPRRLRARASMRSNGGYSYSYSDLFTWYCTCTGRAAGIVDRTPSGNDPKQALISGCFGCDGTRPLSRWDCWKEIRILGPIYCTAFRRNRRGPLEYLYCTGENTSRQASGTAKNVVSARIEQQALVLYSIP